MDACGPAIDTFAVLFPAEAAMTPHIHQFGCVSDHSKCVHVSFQSKKKWWFMFSNYPAGSPNFKALSVVHIDICCCRPHWWKLGTVQIKNALKFIRKKLIAFRDRRDEILFAQNAAGPRIKRHFHGEGAVLPSERSLPPKKFKHYDGINLARCFVWEVYRSNSVK